MTDKITIHGEGSEIALLGEVITLQRRVEELERVLRTVDRYGYGDAWPACPWCDRPAGKPHTPDCPRQAALGKE